MIQGANVKFKMAFLASMKHTMKDTVLHTVCNSAKYETMEYT